MLEFPTENPAADWTFNQSATRLVIIISRNILVENSTNFTFRVFVQ